MDPYDIGFKQTFYNDMVGVRDFTKYPKRPDVLKGTNTESSATSEKIVNGKYNTLRKPHLACAFGKLMSRDNIYERMNGLPKKTKEEMAEIAK